MLIVTVPVESYVYACTPVSNDLIPVSLECRIAYILRPGIDLVINFYTGFVVVCFCVVNFSLQ